MSGWRAAVPEGLAALVVLVAGAIEMVLSVHYGLFENRGTVVPIVVGTVVAVGLSRRWRGVALAVTWLIGGYQLVTHVPVLLVQMALAAVVFGASRWGSTIVTVMGALSVPLAAVPVAVSLKRYDAVLVAVLLLGISWMAGLALRRLADRADQSVASQRAAEENARLRSEQAQFAHDVHDVVGHSLAVILAQAESAQFLDTAALRGSMATIADLARASLQDVRQVLSPSEPVPGELRTLVERVGASGHEIAIDETGTVRTLPPELATVAYRVLQEMLTNAIRHGSRDTPIAVGLCWADKLRIETSNSAPGKGEAGDGRGLAGMRARLESVGGRLELRRDVPGRFTASAWVPIRRLAP
ncbi:histidine kinase [Kibdelosporangium philippinense]|uniref:histidine kinase n=1 Tax=Kibdelosporangium philippinense TaxID=211113 RepID=A0ABS8ZAN2_9PSEU|nr:histidine kinase [Kibdelosporangium philippinense]MCE7003746.1 histidine kinase [Kibdelosporangium philippinense]